METESVLFNSHGEEINIHYLTRVNRQIIYQINARDCIRYITLDDANIEHIGFVYGDKLHIFRLVDGEIPDELKSHFFHIDEEKMNILSNKIKPPEWEKTRKELVKYLDHIPNFIYLRENEIKCQQFRELNETKALIEQLNELLHQTCPGYSLNIDYIFRLRDPSTVSTFSSPFDANTLLLCLFNGNNCVSSLELDIDTNLYQHISISSKTNKLYEKRKYNKLLRAVIIIIAKTIDPVIKIIVSEAVNSISAYLMLHSFNAVYKNRETNKILDRDSTFDEIKAEMESREDESIVSRVELTDENIENAHRIFERIIENINCDPVTDAAAKGIKTKRRRSRNKIKTRRSYK